MKYFEYEDEDLHKVTIRAAKRLGIEWCDWMAEDEPEHWFRSYSPRNRNTHGEGTWADWMELAKLILAHPLSKPTKKGVNK